MNATELYHKDGRPTGVFYCTECRYPGTQAATERCCKNQICSTCGNDTGSKSQSVCTNCWNAKQAAQEAERFAAAEKVTEWDGWVCDGDTFYETVDHYLETHDDDELPEYLWTCESNHFFVNARVSDITDRMCDNAYEDFDPDELDGLKELEAALDAFNEANKSVCFYVPNYKKAVLIPKQK